MDVTNIRVPLINLKREFYMNSQKLGSIDNSIDRLLRQEKRKKKKLLLLIRFSFGKSLFIWPDVLLTIDKGIPFSDTSMQD